MHDIRIPDEIDFLSFFACETKRDEYDELTLSYEHIDRENNRLEFSFNEGTQTICTALYRDKGVLEKSMFDGLSKIDFVEKKGKIVLGFALENSSNMLNIKFKDGKEAMIDKMYIKKICEQDYNLVDDIKK